MKKFFSLTLILFVFCLSFTLCGTFVSSDKAEADAAGTTLVFSQDNKDEFISFVQGYGTSAATQQKADIRLAGDIDLGGAILTNTIGTEALPFMGTFNGAGYRLSNFTIDVFNDMTEPGAEIVQKQYAGLFGVTNNAYISNLDITNRMTVKVGGCVSAYVGVFVGRAYVAERIGTGCHRLCFGRFDMVAVTQFAAYYAVQVMFQIHPVDGKN